MILIVPKTAFTHKHVHKQGKTSGNQCCFSHTLHELTTFICCAHIYFSFLYSNIHFFLATNSDVQQAAHMCFYTEMIIVVCKTWTGIDKLFHTEALRSIGGDKLLPTEALSSNGRGKFFHTKAL